MKKNKRSPKPLTKKFANLRFGDIYSLGCRKPKKIQECNALRSP